MRAGARHSAWRADGRGGSTATTRSVGPDDPLRGLPIPGSAAVARTASRLQLRTVRDLVFYLPRAYRDLREIHRVHELVALPEETLVAVRGVVRSLQVEQTWRRRIQRTVALLADETGEVEAIWFGRRFIERRLRVGDRIVASGKLRRRGWSLILDNPEFEPDDGGEPLHAGRIVPVYRLRQGLSATQLRVAVRRVLDVLHYPDYLPEPIRSAEGLLPLSRAIEGVHYPANPEDQEAAVRRLAFDELLALQVGMVGRRRARGCQRGVPIPIDDARHRRIVVALEERLRRRAGPSAALTPDQKAALAAIRDDLASGTPMLRLLQGDVGSGKTLVAAYAMAAVALAGHQAVLLAPTDLLARQHLETVADLVADLGLPVGLLTGSLPAPARRRMEEALATGEAAIVVGTHALFGEGVRPARLALVVIDEQHRFGVQQRAALEEKADLPPHVLLMTATPIPRTLGQVLYADLDVSDLRTPPAGRRPVRTAIRHPDELDRLWEFVRAEARRGHQTFVVVPLVEEGDDEVAGAEAEADRLRRLLHPLRVGLVHGRMRPAERDATMAAFREGSLDLLVGTTVLEVGVDVPQATVMVIEGAERFGLAQLHQLRGRVGRGTAPGFCVLVSDAQPGSVGEARLRALLELSDGFALAEADFRLRGEGDVLGFVQSGLPRFRIASLHRTAHRDLARRARQHAEEMVGEDGSLRAGFDALAHELRVGWLRQLAAAEPASAL